MNTELSAATVLKQLFERKREESTERQKARSLSRLQEMAAHAIAVQVIAVQEMAAQEMAVQGMVGQ